MKNRTARLRAYLVAGLATQLLPAAAYAQHEHSSHTIEEIIVSSSQDKTRSETALPVNVLGGERLRENAAATLGETIKNSVGVHSSSFGAGVGQPVIRGLGGNRVHVLQNGLGTLDASGASQDHASSVEALLAERIEIIRGPATLLYGNGAMAGVVNVIDNRIPEDVPAATNGALELRANSVDSGRVAVGKVDGGTGDIAWHLNGLFRETEAYDIPGWAVDEAAVEALSHEDEAEEEHEEHEELENTKGFVANSFTDAESLTAGASWIGEERFLGVSVSHLENEYGLPPGGHGHHHEEEHEEEEEEVQVEEHAESIRLDMEQTRVDLKGGVALNGFFEQLDLQLTSSRYEHTELEGGEQGTVFENDGIEGRATLKHGKLGGLSGLVGLQVEDQVFSAVGEEAFIPRSDIRSAGLFALETFEADALTYEAGLRVNRQSIDTHGACDSEESSWSASAAAIWDFRQDSNATLAFNRSERAATVEELYSNVNPQTCAPPIDPEAYVVHATTARFELGNNDLGTETANNIEISLRKHLGDVRAELNAFYNRFEDFIFLADVGEFEETIVSRYRQENATFKGVEGQILFPIVLGDTHLDLTLFADYVEARLQDGGKLPRIPPARGGFEVAYAVDRWSTRLRTTAVSEQNDVAAGELETDGYVLVDAYLDYHIPLGGTSARERELLLFAKGRNLGDEEVRDHTSFLKNFAPAPGRSLEVGMRYRF